MVRSVGGPGNPHQPHSIKSSNTQKPSEGLQSVVQKVNTAVPGNFSRIGNKPVFTKRAADPSLVKDVNLVAKRAFLELKGKKK